jgi:glycosyltransferase involved in cell wall biosynthesis
MTNNSVNILINDYGLPKEKINMIAHGTHLVRHINKDILKTKYGLKGRKVLTTFGLLSSGKSIETTIKALPEIVKSNPDVLFLVIGKTHPEVLKEEGEEYRNSLEKLVAQLNLTTFVKFINSYLSLEDLLEYLQLTDIYLFTTKDPNQAVSGTFAYAMSCGCPIISTPIPHAKEVLTKDTGIIFDFLDSKQLANAVILLLNDSGLRRSKRINTLQKIVSTAWENSAVKHTMLFKKISHDKIAINYNLPEINLNHIKQMTTETGIIQFSRINQPDLCSGYTLDDNARALASMVMNLGISHDPKSLPYIRKYLSFIKLCQQPGGDFLNYIDFENKFTNQNKVENLDDANGRALWALGYVISERKILPGKIGTEANRLFVKAIPHIETIYSARAMALAIKGLYYFQKGTDSERIIDLVKIMADRLVQMYRHESEEKWKWFESYLTYANSVLPEAMLYAWLITGDLGYKKIAVSSMNFLLSIIFNEKGIEVISNKNWLKKGQMAERYGEQPIDVAYTIMTLSRFYEALGDTDYYKKMETAFNWFLGSNRLNQIIYNPCTGGCYDGLEETHVNLNQGAESSLSYLMARLTIEKYNSYGQKHQNQFDNISASKALKGKSAVMSIPDNTNSVLSFISDNSGIKRGMKPGINEQNR